MPVSLKSVTNLVWLKQKKISALAKWHKDGLFYNVTILETHNEQKVCKVRFEDGLESMIKTSDIHIEIPLNEIQVNDVSCCICDGDKSQKPNEIIMCDQCNQGYHINCHEPSIDRDSVKLDDEEVNWDCATCQIIKVQLHSSQQVSQSTNSQSETKKSLKTPKSKSKDTPKVKMTRTPRCKAKPSRRARSAGPEPKHEPNEMEEKSNITHDSAANLDSNGNLNIISPEKPAQSLFDTKTATTQPKRKIEYLGPELADAAKKLATADSSLIATDDLVGILCNVKANEPIVPLQKSEEDCTTRDNDNNNGKTDTSKQSKNVPKRKMTKRSVAQASAAAY